MNSPAWIGRSLLGALLVCMPSLVLASPVYKYSNGQYGDTAAPSDMNDHGVIVWTGFCDAECGARLSTIGQNNIQIVSGYGNSTVVYVGDINNNGDMLGDAEKGGVRVPTMWIEGVPYDLTDPANSGLVFNFDPGPKWVNNFDLLALDVMSLPAEFRPVDYSPCFPPFDYGYGNCFGTPTYLALSSALTNSRGDYVFTYVRADDDFPRSYGELTRLLPEPTTLALVGTALFGVAATRRRRAMKSL